MTDRESADRRAEVESRTAAVRELLARGGRVAALLRLRRNFAWLTAGGSSHIVLATEVGTTPLLVTGDGVVALAPNIEADRIRDEELAGLGIEVVPLDWWQPEAIVTEARRRAGAEPASDEDLEADLVRLRSRLSPFDQRRLAWIGGRAVAAVDAALGDLSGEESETDLATSVVARLADLRAPVVLVAADDRIVRYRHPLPTRAPIRRRVMLVIVAEAWGLHAAVTRFRELEPPGPELERRFAAARDVERALHDATAPGATLGDAFAAAQAAYARAGFPEEWRDHHQGGTIAYQGREVVARPGDATPIEAGMAFAWNPSVAGAKVEDTFVLAADGSRAIVTRR